MSDNRGINFAGWMIGVWIAVALGFPLLVALLCCGGGALVGIVSPDPSATP